MHTVEKIGGTSMREFEVVLNNIVLEGEKTGRIFVVSAYAGVTNLLLEHKKTGEDGVYKKFAKRDKAWNSSFDKLLVHLKQLNKKFVHLGLDINKANQFIEERVEGTRVCLKNIESLCSYGHFDLEQYLPAVREMLSSIGEAHSAYNSTQILNVQGIKTFFADLTGWKDLFTLSLDKKIGRVFDKVDLSKTLAIATGYIKCLEGLMKTYDRGYSEITFSKIACLTKAKEGVIHKEFHLSTADPKIVGKGKVQVIGRTNFDIADQLADLGMEAIHPKASKDMEVNNISIRIKNSFEPNHKGTLISRDFVGKEPRVEIITGRKDLVAIEVLDSAMVGASGYDYSLSEFLAKYKISYITKNTNANTITHYVAESSKRLSQCVGDLKKNFPYAKISLVKVAVVCAIGSNMAFPGLLAQASGALAQKNINILAVDQCMRQVNMQFIIKREDFERATCVLHQYLVENKIAN